MAASTAGRAWAWITLSVWAPSLRLPDYRPRIGQQSGFEPVLEAADIIYFSGGDPVYLYQTLQGSRAWAAAQKAWARGAIYAGCSAGAMILAQSMPNLRMAGLNSLSGFGLFPAAYVFPHFDAMPVIFKPMVQAMRRSLKDGQFILGIDENTALVGKLQGEWRVRGEGRVHLIRARAQSDYGPDDLVEIQPVGNETS